MSESLLEYSTSICSRVAYGLKVSVIRDISDVLRVQHSTMECKLWVTNYEEARTKIYTKHTAEPQWVWKTLPGEQSFICFIRFHLISYYKREVNMRKMSGKYTYVTNDKYNYNTAGVNVPIKQASHRNYNSLQMLPYIPILTLSQIAFMYLLTTYMYLVIHSRYSFKFVNFVKLKLSNLTRESVQLYCLYRKWYNMHIITANL